MDPQSLLFLQKHRDVTRRWFLGQMGLGIGGLALSSMITEESSIAGEPFQVLSAPHFAPPDHLHSHGGFSSATGSVRSETTT